MSQTDLPPPESEQWAEEEPEAQDNWGAERWDPAPLEEEEPEIDSVEVKEKEEDVTMSGTCRWFNQGKGFGFIEVQGDKSIGDVWVHKSQIQKVDGEVVPLVEGQKCSFTLDKRQKKDNNFKALKVVLGELPAPKEDKKMTGVCLWYSDDRAYGFITPDEGDEDLFVHEDSINGSEKTLVEGQKVEFTIGRDNTGRLRAIKVIPGTAPAKATPVIEGPFEGICVKWVIERGFGFIQPGNSEDPDDQIIVHCQNIIPDAKQKAESELTLAAGQSVSYKKQRRKNRQPGYEAVEVVPGKVPKEEIFSGYCKWFDPVKGFGFIARDNFQGDDYHVRITDIIAETEDDRILEEQQRCTFVIQRNYRKPKPGEQRKIRSSAIKVNPGETVAPETPAGKRDKSGKGDEFEPYIDTHEEPEPEESSGSDTSPAPPARVTNARRISEQDKSDKQRKIKNWKKSQRKKRKEKKEKEAAEAAETKPPAKSEGNNSINGTNTLVKRKKQKKKQKKKSTKSKVHKKNTDNAINDAINKHFADNAQDNQTTAKKQATFFGSTMGWFRRWCSRGSRG